MIPISRPAFIGLESSLRAVIDSDAMPRVHKMFLIRLLKVYSDLARYPLISIDEKTGMPAKPQMRLMLEQYAHARPQDYNGGSEYHKLMHAYLRTSQSYVYPPNVDANYEVNSHELHAYGMLYSGYWANFVANTKGVIIPIDQLDRLAYDGELQVCTVGPHRRIDDGYITSYTLNHFRSHLHRFRNRIQVISAQALHTVPDGYHGSLEGRVLRLS